mgnify:FL=1
MKAFFKAFFFSLALAVLMTGCSGLVVTAHPIVVTVHPVVHYEVVTPPPRKVVVCDHIGVCAWVPVHPPYPYYHRPYYHR